MKELTQTRLLVEPNFDEQNTRPAAILLTGPTEPVAPVAQRYHVTSDTLGREFDPGKRIFLTEKLKNENKNAQRVEND